LEYIASEGQLKKFDQLSLEEIQWIDSLIGLQYHADYFNNNQMNKYQNTYIFRKLQDHFSTIKKNFDEGYRGPIVNYMNMLMHDTNLLGILNSIGLSSFECIKKSFENK